MPQSRRFGHWCSQARRRSIFTQILWRLTIVRRGRRPFDNRRPEDETRVNSRIRAKEVRVIDPDGEQIGVMSPEQALEKAEEFGLDLVEVSPKSNPPVCRIMDYGKFKYQQSKKKSSNKSDTVQLKTFRIRPNISDHDILVKLKQAAQAIDDGDQVKIVMRLKGREHAFTERWVEKLNEVVAQLQELVERDSKVTQVPKPEGREITAMVEPA